MAITTEQIKQLRDKTGISVMQCKKALEEAVGDIHQLQVDAAAVAFHALASLVLVVTVTG